MLEQNSFALPSLYVSKRLEIKKSRLRTVLHPRTYEGRNISIAIDAGNTQEWQDIVMFDAAPKCQLARDELHEWYQWLVVVGRD